MLWIISAVVVAVILIVVFNRRAGRRFGEAANAQISKAGNWFWKRDPQAIYQHRVDEATEEIRNATTAVEEHRALINSLNRQVDENRREVAILDIRIKSSLKDDPQDLKGRAANYAVQLKTTQNNLKNNEDQLNKATILYQNNIKKINLARTRIKEAEDEGHQLGLELKMAKTEAAINNLASSCNINMKSVDGLSEAKEEIRRQIDRERAKGDVATDLGTNGMMEIEEEERLKRLEGQELLEKYKQDMGLNNEK